MQGGKGEDGAPGAGFGSMQQLQLGKNAALKPVDDDDEERDDKEEKKVGIP